MPLVSHPPCPGCGRPLVRKPGGKCPDCGERVADYVSEERRREERIERVMAVVATILVLGLLVFSSGLALVEGVIAYAVAGAAVWFFAQKTFGSRRKSS